MFIVQVFAITSVAKRINGGSFLIFNNVQTDSTKKAAKLAIGAGIDLFGI